MFIKEFDIVIVGAGVAGLNTAWQLAKNGLKVGLIESKTNILNISFFTLGSFLEPAKFNLSDKVILSKINSVVFYSKHSQFVGYGSANILDKKQLHKELLEKNKDNGVELLPGTRVVSYNLDQNNNIQSLVDSTGNFYKAKIFIDASGHMSVLTKEFKLQDQILKTGTGIEYNCQYFGDQNKTYLLVGKTYLGGYGWIFPTGNNRAIVGYGTFNNNVEKEIKNRLDLIFKDERLKDIIKKDNNVLFGGTIPITSVKSKFVDRNLVAVGDSVSQINPIVGEGYRYILESSTIAAKHIVNAIFSKNNNLLLNYEKEWRNKFFHHYKLSKILQRIAAFASNSDLLSDVGVLSLYLKKQTTLRDLIAGEVTWKKIIFP